MQKIWRILEGVGEVVSLAEDVHPAVQRMLQKRGIVTAEELRRFFAPSWEEGIHDPFLFRQMSTAVDRLMTAIERGEKIVVHGDYDADGVSGSAVLITTIRELLKHGDQDLNLVESYIPHRDREGYGLHIPTVDALADRGTRLIITVDCGIANVLEIAHARLRGIDVIVVDHHQFGDVLPDAILIHPRLPGESYPFPHLAAVGVAFKFACGIIHVARGRGMDIPTGWEKWLLDFVSIATVTDMVSLTGENRVLETFGLMVMNKTRRPGLQKLITSAGRTFGSLTSEDIGFVIGPRINAAGRMDHASLALKLLLAETDTEVETCLAEIERCNRERQQQTQQMVEVAEEQFNAVSSEQRIHIFWSADWSPSLVGLVAGKFLERTGKPTIAIGKFGDRWVGSGRSFTAYDITQAVKDAGEGLLTHSGGHVQACGFSFEGDATVPLFIDRLRAHADARLQKETRIPTLAVDLVIAFEDVTWKLIEDLKRCEPFGEGNRKPLFLTEGMVVIGRETMGSTGAHLRCAFKSPRGTQGKFVWFGASDRIEELTVGKSVDVVYEVGVNEWKGRKEIQCRVVDVRSSSENSPSPLLNQEGG